jgi:hypothetical protein
MKFNGNLKDILIIFALFALIASIQLLKVDRTEKNKDNDKKKKLTTKTRAENENRNSDSKKKISEKAFGILNNTLVGPIDIPRGGISLQTNKWDLKMTMKQVEDLTNDMQFSDMKGVTEKSFRSFQYNIITPFEKCDVDKDMLLSLKEFTSCIKTDKYLTRISVPDSKFPLQGATMTYKDFDEYAKILYEILDESRMGKMNFYNYVQLRLLNFAWVKCSTGAPFIEEVGFECAIEKVSGWKTMNRNLARSLLENTMTFSGAINRQIDFVIFANVGLSVRLFGKINRKEDNLANKSEMSLALDNNVLPERFNAKTIEYIFKLSNDDSNTNSLGIDLISFCFYDHWLKIFDKNSEKNRFYLNVDEFIKLNTHYLFPENMKATIRLIPQNTLSDASYNMFEDLNKNMKPEENHFLKAFIQLNEMKKNNKVKWNLEQARGENKKLAYDAKKTLTNIFNTLDSGFIGKINFYDFGSFAQLLHVFTKNDPDNAKGRLVAGELEKLLAQYNGYPVISKNFLARAKRLKALNTDLYMDFASLLLMMRLEDIIPLHNRRLDKAQINEIELKTILSQVNRRFIPDAHLKNCLRNSPDADKKIPVYDWECAFVSTETSTLKFFENSFDYLTSVTRKIKLGPTEFNNKDFGLE